jgi:hypothetical protein
MSGGAMASEAAVERLTMISTDPVAGENLRLTLVVFGSLWGFE